MSVVSAMNSSLRGEMGAGRRRVRATIAMPVVVSCGLLGVVAGLLFPPPAAVTRESSAFFSTGHESMPKAEPGAGRAVPAATPQPRDEKLSGSSEPLTPQPDRSASTPQEQASSERTEVAAPLAASQKYDAVEQPSQATSRVAQGRQRAKHDNLPSDHIGQGKRERSARRRISRRVRPAKQGQLSQLPILGPVAGILLP